MKDDFNKNYQVITTTRELENAVETFEKETTIAVDLEADSMFHFKEKVCLIQMASKKINILIDPLHVKDISPLKPLFSDRKIKKIFHGADYDVRSLHRDFKISINNLFDTEIASKFLGARETGLDAVLRQRFNIALDKKYQKKDWSQRPLPEPMMEYAAGDTIHLIPLAEILERELKEKGRLEWVAEECDLLSKARQIPTNGMPLFLKFKGAGRLDSKSLAVLESFLRFRQKIAKDKDRPLFKVIGNNTLMKLAQIKPLSLKHLKNIKGISPKHISMYGMDFVQLINKALKLPETKLPVYPRSHKRPNIGPDVPPRIKALKAWRDETASTLDIDPTLIFNKAMLSTIALCNPQNQKELKAVKGIKKWQIKAFGRNIVPALKLTS